MNKIARSALLILKKLRYLIVIALGFVVVTFVDEYSIMRNIQLRSEISDTKEEIAKYAAQYDHDVKRLKALRHNRRTAEAVARELYYMKTDDEDIFVLSDDAHTEPAPANETAE